MQAKTRRKIYGVEFPFFFLRVPVSAEQAGTRDRPWSSEMRDRKKKNIYWSTFFLAAKKNVVVGEGFFLPVTRVYFSATVAQITVGPLSHFRQEALKKWLSGRLGSAR